MCPLFQEDEPEVVVCLGVIRLQRDGATVGISGRIEPSPVLQDHAEIVVRFGMVRFEPNDLFRTWCASGSRRRSL